MSLIQATTSLLALKPRVWRDENRLCVRTGFLARLLCLFAAERSVVVDPAARVIRITSRAWWFARRRSEIPFDRVVHIDYRFDSLPTGFSIVGTTDQVESFTIALELKDPRETVDLATFQGEGSRMTGWEGALLGGDSLIDWTGDQEDASRGFVRTLQAILRVPVGAPVPHVADAAGVLYCCTSCRRNSPPRRIKCQYCGGAVATVTSTSTS